MYNARTQECTTEKQVSFGVRSAAAVLPVTCSAMASAIADDDNDGWKVVSNRRGCKGRGVRDKRAPCGHASCSAHGGGGEVSEEEESAEEEEVDEEELAVLVEKVRGRREAMRDEAARLIGFVVQRWMEMDVQRHQREMYEDVGEECCGNAEKMVAAHARRHAGVMHRCVWRQVVIYGLGSPSAMSQDSARKGALAQLGLVLAMVDRMHEVSEKAARVKSIVACDPVFSALDAALLRRFGIETGRSDDARRRAAEPTLMFMVHCPRHLYDNVMRSNRDVESLRKLTILGNSLHRLAESVNGGGECEVEKDARARKATLLNAVRTAAEMRIDWLSDTMLYVFGHRGGET